MTLDSFFDKVVEKIYFPLLIVCIAFDILFNKRIESRVTGYFLLYDIRLLLHTMVYFNISMLLVVRFFGPMPKLVPQKWVIWGRAAVIISLHLLFLLYLNFSLIFTNL